MKHLIGNYKIYLNIDYLIVAGGGGGASGGGGGGGFYNQIIEMDNPATVFVGSGGSAGSGLVMVQTLEGTDRIPS